MTTVINGYTVGQISDLHQANLSNTNIVNIDLTGSNLIQSNILRIISFHSILNYDYNYKC